MPRAPKLKTAQPDRRIKSEMVELDNELHRLATDHRKPDDFGDESTQRRPNFPAKLTAVDDMDDYMERKMNADEKAFGLKTMERSDLEWIKRKEQNAQVRKPTNTKPAKKRAAKPAKPKVVKKKKTN